MFSVDNDLARRTVRVQLSGQIRPEEMKEFAEAYCRATDAQNGPHLVLADMRGLRPTEETCTQILGDAIAYARQNGVICCAHVSDSTISRLQVLRVARRVDPEDQATINCESVEEAEQALLEMRTRIQKAG